MKALIDITREIVDERENFENLGGKKYLVFIKNL